MSQARNFLHVAEDTIINADIRNCHRLEVLGRIEGDVVTREILVHPTGSVVGRVRAESAEILGTVEGEVVVRNLISIRPSGIVQGDVQYGRMVLDPGGELSAKVRNVPPHLVGDFSLAVRRGQQIVVTTQDLAAIDPDNTPDELRYSVSNNKGGHVAFTSAPAVSLSNFTQADLNKGIVAFVHDGNAGRNASFDVVVADTEGGTSGKPRTVDVVVGDAA
ncbi:MAG: polymer-forming cytoskeletal protein [Hyphomicrobiaceae bacterium]|nr:polymer-forming cytoskeletal protein [Hyphomicrobiaceae bacterium]